MLEYKCRLDDEIWNASIKNIKEEIGYSILEIEGKSSRIVTYIGKNDGQYWCFFPEHELSSGLSYPDDLFWNIEKLQRLFGNSYDAVTVSCGIQTYSAYKQAASSDIEEYIKHLKGRIYTNKVSVVLYDKPIKTYHLLFRIQRSKDECMMLSFRKYNDHYCYDISAPLITQLNYYYGYCQILRKSSYTDKNIYDIISELRKDR